MKITRAFTQAGKSPYESIAFRRATSEIKNPDSSVVFRLDGFMVPGVGSTLAGMNSLVDRAEAVQAQADRFTPGPAGDVSVIAWLDYDAPGMDTGADSLDPPTALDSEGAEVGVRALNGE